MKTQPLVFTIAAVSGGGKTTVTKRLLSRLNNSKALYFDDYDFLGAPEDICQWVEEGSDHSQWNLTPLIDDVQYLINEPGLEYVILDYPFAYAHEEMRKYIHFTIFIDTPLDIALARRIIRDYSDHRVEDIQRDMTRYLNRGRLAYLKMLQTIKPDSDLVIDGTLAFEDIVERIIQIVEELRQKQVKS